MPGNVFTHTVEFPYKETRLRSHCKPCITNQRSLSDPHVTPPFHCAKKTTPGNGCGGCCAMRSPHFLGIRECNSHPKHDEVGGFQNPSICSFCSWSRNTSTWVVVGSSRPRIPNNGVWEERLSRRQQHGSLQNQQNGVRCSRCVGTLILRFCLHRGVQGHSHSLSYHLAAAFAHPPSFGHQPLRP